MNIISWNVNGIRSCHKKGCWDWLIKESPDILCLQETKAHPEQLPEEVKSPEGYFSYFGHSKIKKGYSGVALYSKQKPVKVNIGLGIPEFDEEGRIITAFFKEFVVSNIYFPNGGRGPHRIKFKLEFYKAFLSYVERLRKEGYKIIFCGDVNTAHEEIDLARPKENEKNTGFLPEERAWLNEVTAKGYIDIFRKLNPETRNAYTYWDMKTFARERNVGWRIDYFFISPDVEKSVISTDILKDITGSDHCPISLSLNL